MNIRVNPLKLPFELFANPGRLGKSHSSASTLKLHETRALNSANTNVSVNAANGNVVVQDKQFTIADDGIEISVGMTWNAADNVWRFFANSTVKENANSYGRFLSALNYNDASIDITESDGRVVKYLKKHDQYICAEPDGHGISIITKENG